MASVLRGRILPRLLSELATAGPLTGDELSKLLDVPLPCVMHYLRFANSISASVRYEKDA